MQKTNFWYTLVEVIIAIMMSTMILLVGFYALSSISIWKVRLLESATITKDVSYFSEKLFQEIKSWWTIDYEEYFNRMVINWNKTWNDLIENWHYKNPTWFWNFGKWWNIWSTTYWKEYYFCRSLTNNFMNDPRNWDLWCYENTSNDFSSTWITKIDINGKPSKDWSPISDEFWARIFDPQRYGQYRFQFIDHNSNRDSDWWDENNDWNIRWDDDDETLWVWPMVFGAWDDVREIYLISWDKRTRLIFRWNIITDEFAPTSESCEISSTWELNKWCRWTIQMLKLVWRDLWMDHNWWWSGVSDGIIDTWIIDPEITWWVETVAGSNNDNYWQDMFPGSINVSKFEVYLYPNIDADLAWKDTSWPGWSNIADINPYLRLNLTLEPSLRSASGLNWVTAKYELNTTINLVDYFSK